METLLNILGYGAIVSVLFVIFYLFAKLLGSAFNALTHHDD